MSTVYSISKGQIQSHLKKIANKQISVAELEPV